MGLNIKKTEDFNEWKEDNPQAFEDEVDRDWETMWVFI